MSKMQENDKKVQISEIIQEISYLTDLDSTNPYVEPLIRGKRRELKNLLENTEYGFDV